MTTFRTTALGAILLCGCPGPVAAQQARAKHPPQTREDNYIALLDAAERGDVRAVRSALRKGVGGHAKDHALMAAAANARPGLVKILLRAGANPNAFFLTLHSFATPLGSAIRGGSTEVIDVLIGPGRSRIRRTTSALYLLPSGSTTRGWSGR